MSDPGATGILLAILGVGALISIPVIFLLDVGTRLRERFVIWRFVRQETRRRQAG